MEFVSETWKLTSCRVFNWFKFVFIPSSPIIFPVRIRVWAGIEHYVAVAVISCGAEAVCNVVIVNTRRWVRLGIWVASWIFQVVGVVIRFLFKFFICWFLFKASPLIIFPSIAGRVINCSRSYCGVQIKIDTQRWYWASEWWRWILWSLRKIKF